MTKVPGSPALRPQPWPSTRRSRRSASLFAAFLIMLGLWVAASANGGSRPETAAGSTNQVSSLATRQIDAGLRVQLRPAAAGYDLAWWGSTRLHLPVALRDGDPPGYRRQAEGHTRGPGAGGRCITRRRTMGTI